MGCTNTEALKLPDQLLVRYFRAGEIEAIAKVKPGKDGSFVVSLRDPKRTDHWRDLGGGLGFVPEGE
ncbi:MAG: hypothetical protein ABMA13_20160 [Chthoniobacteraceae bacterium]